MKMLVGLGNPGERYQHNRHNIGFRFLDLIAKLQGLRFAAAPRFRAETCTWESPEGRVLLVKPQTFMNNSGEAIGPLARYYQIETPDIFVVYDDLDLPSGKFRFKTGGGHGGHNGLRSMNQHLPDANYHRIKVGIGRPEFGEITAWVLGNNSEREQATENMLFAALEEELPTVLGGHAAKASNRIHLKLGDTKS